MSTGTKRSIELQRGT